MESLHGHHHGSRHNNGSNILVESPSRKMILCSPFSCFSGLCGSGGVGGRSSDGVLVQKEKE